MENSIENKLIEIGKIFFNESELSFSKALLEELEPLKMDNSSKVLAFFSSVDIENPNISEIIKKEFGEEIITRIQLFKRLSKVKVSIPEKKTAELRKQFIELTTDIRIIIIKLFERLVLLKQSMNNNPNGDYPDSVSEIADECLKLYSPIAHRLGIRLVYNQMEDLSFKVLYPDEFKKLSNAVEKKRKVYLKKLADMEQEIKKNLLKYGIKANIHSRVKRVYSIFNKIKNKNVSLEEIFDLMALRVITETPEQCYLTLGAVHSKWIPIENRFRDWISFPKPNGYRSIQTTVLTGSGDKFEIQIRTEQMHREAEFGSAAHWAYKEKIETSTDWITRLKEFLENDEYFENPAALDELLSYEAKRSFVHIMTPKGEVKTLPEGATALDFAFLVHTEVGLKAVGARINGKFARLKTTLKTGDIVEISTQKNAKPSRDWLSFVKMPSARSKIALWIRKNETLQTIAEGKRIWEKYKKKYRTKLAGADDEQSLKQNLLKVGYKNSDDFYTSIGIKSLKLSQSLLRKLYPKAYERKYEDKKGKVFENKPALEQQPKVEIEGNKKIAYTMAKCCNPEPGKNIVAYLTKNITVKIHTEDCLYVNSGLFDKERILKAKWL